MNKSKIISSNKSQIKNLFIIIIALVLFDQLTKVVAQKYLENSPEIVLIPSLLSLNFVKNEIVHLHQYIIYFSLCIIVFPAIILHAINKSISKLIVIGLVVLCGAVLSNNIIDAFALGYIRDFIKLHGVATGNIADQYRTFGVILLIVGFIIKDQKKFTPILAIIILISIIIFLILSILFWRYLSSTLAI